ncbi:MAG: GSCFA domain-containing protein [Paludibacter sp.]|nr:GSCFA domain-containing protein [Paludibacter sp.]
MFRSVVQIPSYPEKISYEHNIMSLGSCFSENIGMKLQSAYFSIDINPFGILFNPVSIKNCIEKLIKNNAFVEKDLFKHQSLWGSFYHSTLFSATSPEVCLKNINERFEKGHENLEKANFLLITFGTAWIFEHKETNTVVTNCHKLPASNFVRRRLSVDEIVSEYIALFHKLHILYPTLKIILTVSPVRHWKDGANDNNLSKSILLLAVDKIQSLFEHVFYFPAYEIMMDELRDYRFYDKDMFHPSEVAIDYIWQRFSETFFSQKTLQLKKKLENIRQQTEHRPIHPDTIEHSYFMYMLEQQKAQLKQQYPFLAGRI